MFNNNIGDTIRRIAVIVLVCGILAAIIGAFSLWSQNTRYTPTVAAGFGVLIGGIVTSWVSYIFIEGFGQLINDAQKTRWMLHKMMEESRSASVNASASATGSASSTWRCKSCGHINPDSKSFCTACSTAKFSPIVTKTSSLEKWTCKKCGMMNSSSSISCISCGTYK